MFRTLFSLFALSLFRFRCFYGVIHAFVETISFNYGLVLLWLHETVMTLFASKGVRSMEELFWIH